MSLAVSTARSAVWMLVGKLVANVAGIVGTILVINLLDAGAGKAEYGLATAAWLVVATASQFTTLGIGQFVVVKARDRPDLAFHATVFHNAIGVVAMLAVYAGRDRIASWIDAEGMSRFVAGLAVATMLDRISLVPERVLMRSMKFRIVAVSRTLGDLVYVGVAITVAALGGGGMAIVGANIARSALRAVILIRYAERRDWLQPVRLRLSSLREIFTFSGPIWIAALSSFAARRGDNLIVSGYYGAEVMGSYNVAYNLAENPPVIAEQAIDVLLPSYAQLEPEARVRGLVRSLSLLSLVTSPLVLGLGAVAPSLVASFLGPERADVAPMLSVLAVMSLTRPLMWASAAYLQATDRPRILMLLEIMTVVTMVAGLLTLGRISVIWACIAVGIATFVRVIVTALVLRRIDRIGLWAFFRPQVMPVVACLPMIGVVVLVRHAVTGVGWSALVSLLAEVAAGGLMYAGAAWALANPTCRDVLDVARRALRRKRP